MQTVGGGCDEAGHAAGRLEVRNDDNNNNTSNLPPIPRSSGRTAHARLGGCRPPIGLPYYFFHLGRGPYTTRKEAATGTIQTALTGAGGPAGLLYTEDDAARLGKHVGQFNRAGLDFRRLVRNLDTEFAEYYLVIEPKFRKKSQTNTQTQTQTTTATDVSRPQNKDNVITEVLRELYEFDGDLPRGPDEGAIPATALKRLCPELRIENLLRILWG